MFASLRLRPGSRFEDGHQGPALFGNPVTTGGDGAPTAGDEAPGFVLRRVERCGYLLAGYTVAEAGTAPLDAGAKGAGPTRYDSHGMGEADRELNAPAAADLTSMPSASRRAGPLDH